MTGLVAGLVLAGAPACAPTVDPGCSADSNCERGEMCDLMVGECVDIVVDTSSTETPAPGSFNGKPVPFFRGNVCTVHDVQTGAAIPVVLDPCLHPCIATNSHHYQHYYNCLGTHCEAWATMFYDADATACPAEAFGKFDAAQCVYGNAVELKITVTVQDEPVSGSLELEVPFLSNADAASLSPGYDSDALNAAIEHYPQEPNRIVGGMPITLSTSSPAPPASCAGGACPCYQVGF
ncbi:MAG TPA: hypothetical protein VG755_10280 [Nannocystaceae bacterium]|nr:hypothetical protein [Nannocystaceae bacterium]